MCEKCEQLKKGMLVKLGRGTLYMHKVSCGEIKEASDIWESLHLSKVHWIRS